MKSNARVKRKDSAIEIRKKALILAHYYVNDDTQEIADYVGDSY